MELEVSHAIVFELMCDVGLGLQRFFFFSFPTFILIAYPFDSSNEKVATKITNVFQKVHIRLPRNSSETVARHRFSFRIAYFVCVHSFFFNFLVSFR